ncbi:hypothetical protein IFM89_026440 [Coptis chinensis]|uniref:SWIM-type domain-containing protein n=1 Tax=Coptis chinensis TaxID=261450 RepID=A0A835LF66_9MAGN|nr:hypothetical protein IFM89_026440 [Coptis chinensis]
MGWGWSNSTSGKENQRTDKKKVHWYHVESSNEVVISVKTENGTRFCVNLVDHECSCMRWQLSGIVCVHAVAVLYPRRVYWKEYCSSYYWVSTYKLAYMGHIMPMPDMSEWPMNCTNHAMPPYVRGIGRPKKARTRGADEEVNPNKQIRLCSKCKQPGHNAKTCKGLPTTKKDKHGKKSQEETQSSQASALVPEEALESIEASQASSHTQPGHNAKTCKISTPKSSLQASQASSSTPQSTAQVFKAPEQRHTFGDFLSKQSSKSSTSVLEAAELTFTAGGTIRAPIAIKRPRPHGLGSTPFKPARPTSQS